MSDPAAGVSPDSVLAAVTPLVPFLAALVGFGLSWRGGFADRSTTGSTDAPGRRAAVVLAVSASALSAAATIVVAVVHGAGDPTQAIVRYAPTGRFDLWLGARVDGLAAIVGVLVGVVALCVQVYSVSSMRDDRRYPVYAAFVSLFTAAMLLVVYSADLLVLLVGWEVMGACSYFLIGHHWERREARSAAIKAFLVTKTGDVPFLFGLFVLGLDAHTLRIDGVLRAAGAQQLHHATLASLLLLCGVVGKSGQFPLHTWLPDAMAGPTPISALIHAATMVAAGVFVVARLYPVFLAAPDALVVLAVVACVTMFGAALAAFAQQDLKRVLAYSTVSQLGYMAAALGVGGRDAAVFQLLSHGAFKALLFLAAGVLIHEAGGNDLAVIGAAPRLPARLPVTFVTMTIGLASLAGVPPFAGFFSKESVLGAAYSTAVGHAPGSAPTSVGWLVLVVGLATAVLTAGYATRVWVRAFFGSPTPTPDVPDAAPDDTARRREAPGGQLWPLVVLAVPAALLGFAGLDRSWLASLLGTPYGGRYRPGVPLSVTELPGHIDNLAPAVVTTVLSLVAVAVGVAAVVVAWRRAPAEDPARLLGGARSACERGFGVDAAQRALVVMPFTALARLVRWLDVIVVDGYVRGSGIGARAFGGALRRSQNGDPRFYLTGLLAGAIVIVTVVSFGGGR